MAEVDDYQAADAAVDDLLAGTVDPEVAPLATRITAAMNAAAAADVQARGLETTQDAADRNAIRALLDETVAALTSLQATAADYIAVLEAP